MLDLEHVMFIHTKIDLLIDSLVSICFTNQSTNKGMLTARNIEYSDLFFIGKAKILINI